MVGGRVRTRGRRPTRGRRRARERAPWGGGAPSARLRGRGRTRERAPWGGGAPSVRLRGRGRTRGRRPTRGRRRARERAPWGRGAPSARLRGRVRARRPAPTRGRVRTRRRRPTRGRRPYCGGFNRRAGNRADNAIALSQGSVTIMSGPVPRVLVSSAEPACCERLGRSRVLIDAPWGQAISRPWTNDAHVGRGYPQFRSTASRNTDS